MIMATKTNNVSLKLLFILMFGTLILTQVSSQFVYQLISPAATLINEGVVLPSFPRSIATITIIPLIEEWLFREKGLFFLKKFFSSSVSILVSAGLFSIVHGQLYFIPFFLGGIVYGVARLYSKKWWFPVLLHSSYNGVALLITFLEVSI